MPVSPKLASKAVLAKPPYSTKTWGCLAQRHKGTEVKPVNGEKQKDKKDFLCGFVAQCEKQGFGKYASFAETGKQGGFGKTAILNKEKI